MMNKDFENLELRLQKIREESAELFRQSEEKFDEIYGKNIEKIFSQDILGAKRHIKSLFQIKYVDCLRWDEGPDVQKIFQESVTQTVKNLPLNSEQKETLTKSIMSLGDIKAQDIENYYARDSLQMDPYYPLLEDLVESESMSPEEMILIEKSFDSYKNISLSLEKISLKTRSIILEEIWILASHWESESLALFQNEYQQEIHEFEKRDYDIFPVLRFVSKSYFRNAGKLKKREHPKRRMRRTFKMALLRLLQMKFGIIDAQKLLKEFDQCESFTEMMLLIYRLFEVLGENNETKESFQVLEELEIIDSLIKKTENTKKKILAGEKVTAKISSLISETDSQLEEGVLEHILEEDTHFHGDEILFSHGEDEMAGVYADTVEVSQEDEDDVIDSGDTLEWNYKNLKQRFLEIEEEKRKAFLEWNYDEIDVFNKRLMQLESKIEKIGKLLGEES